MYQGPGTGLYSAPNPFSAAPAGSLAVADNVRYTSPVVIEPRPGFGTAQTVAGSLIDAMAFYGAALLASYDLTKVAWAADVDTGFVAFAGTFIPVGDNRMRFELASRCIFFNAGTGLWCWDGVGLAGQPVLAGNAQGLNIRAIGKGTGGWQEPDTAVAYRFTICSKDAFGRIIEGPPSGRVVLRNYIYPGNHLTLSRSGGTDVLCGPGTTGPTGTGFTNFLLGDVVELRPGEANFPAGNKTLTSDTDPFVGNFHYSEAGANVVATVDYTIRASRNAQVTCILPTLVAGVFVSTANFLRVYRSDPTESVNDIPADEMFLVYESPYLTSGQITAGQLVFTDVAPISVAALSTPLYTNPNSGDGSLAANFQPPKALDHAYFANRMWFANTTNKQSLLLTLIGVDWLGLGGGSGLDTGDTITFKLGNGFDFVLTADISVEGYSGNSFGLVGAYGSPSFQIEQTARNLVDCLNNSSDNELIYAYYVSSEAGVPGQMLITYGQFDNDGPLEVYSDRGTAWTPQLPDFASPAFLVKSDDNRHPAGLWNSKLGQPEAVPITNFRVVEADNQEIKRIFPLHFRLLIFKTDGIYFCTNTEPFNVQKMSSFVLLAPDSIALLDERLFCLTDQGIVSISDGGVDPISVPIDDILAGLGGSSLDDLKARTFAVGYRTARQYILWVLEKNDDGTFTEDNAHAYVYSTLSRGFTRYVFGARAAAIDATTDQLIIAPTDSPTLRREAKSLTEFDYADALMNVTVVSVSGSDVTLTSASGVEAGDVIQRSSARFLVLEVNGNVVTVLGTPAFTAGAGFVFKAIACEVQFNPLTAGEPAVMKMTNQVSFLFRRNDAYETTATFASEIVQDPEEVELVAEGWGAFAWGEVAWGNEQRLRRVEPLPLGADNCCQLSVGFRTKQALAKFEFLGIDARLKGDTEANRG